MGIKMKIDWNEVRAYIKNSSKTSSVYIGCDSIQQKNKTRFCLVVIIHIDSSKGGKVFHEVSNFDKIRNLQQRLLKEVEIAVGGAMNIIDVIEDRAFEVHLDINPNPEHKSNVVSREAIGWVLGQGLDCKIKPHSFASSCAADYFVKK